MSYAGTYGPDETCEHDSYWRNCWKCNGDVERFVEDFPKHMAHEAAVEPTVGVQPPIEEHESIVWYCAHVDRVRTAARNWRNSPEMIAEVHRRGLWLDRLT